MLFITAAFLIFYIWIMESYLEGWRAMPLWSVPGGYIPQTSISILLPARNEAENIAACLSSILDNDFPKHLIEIIVIDDFSEDKTAEIVLQFPEVKLLRLADLEQFNENAHKKAALQYAIENSKGKLIITTDADVVVGEQWLKNLVAYHEIKQKDFIAAPVNFHQEKTLLERFQSLDFMGMMGVTGAGIEQKIQLMCNGANLAFTRKIFDEVGGYKDIDNIASGDDMLLMHKVYALQPDTIGFVKSSRATVFTEAKPSLKSFYWQRIRWATKNGGLKDWRVTAILAGIYLYCMFLFFSLIGGLFYSPFLHSFLALFIIKTIQDYRFLKMMAHFFKRKDLLKDYLAQQVMHIAYIIVIGTMSNFSKGYVWKGRRMK